MRRIQLGVLALTLPVLLFSFLAAGCGEFSEGDKPAAKAKKRRPRPKAVSWKPVAGDYSGVLKGVVNWGGGGKDFSSKTQALQSAIDVSGDKNHCRAGNPFEVSQQEYVVGDNSRVGNVFVWIEPEVGYFFTPPQKELDALKAKYKDDKGQPTVGQPHCAFLPHCVVLFPSYRNPKSPKEMVPTGQVLVVKNDASIVHNAKVGGTPSNPFVNKIIPVGREEKFELVPDRDAIKMECGVHGWMRAWARAYDHPYAALTSTAANPSTRIPNPADPAFGQYEIRGVPVGAKVKLFAWHETAGYLTGEKGREIELKKQNEENFDMKPAG